MKIDILTIFPDFFRGPLDYGIIRRSRELGLVEISIHDLRNFTKDKHRTVDDRPFGGGEGMVLKPEPIFECLESLGGLTARTERVASQGSGSEQQSVILLSAQGRKLDQALAAELARLERIVLICGRYEGVDERISEHLADREVSIGDYVLSGGELGAAVIVDTVTRLIPGAVGNEASTRQESFTAGVNVEQSERGANDAPSSTCVSGGLLDYPHYTRPAEFRGMAVPEVLVNGNHEEIRRWRRKRALAKTLRNRPDLLRQVTLSREDRRCWTKLEMSFKFPPPGFLCSRRPVTLRTKNWELRTGKGNIMRNQIIEKLLAKTRRTDLPKFGPGDTIRVQVKIREGEKERLQAFEGVVIARSRGAQPSFTVRKMSFGQGVERIFPVDSKVIDKVELVRSAKVRRAKLYYLRNLRGKAARLKEVE